MTSSSYKELLEVRKKIFLERGIPILYKNGFTKSPFSNTLFGTNNLGDCTYELCRVSKDSLLEMIVTHISKGDRWIKIFLNIFQLRPEITSIEKLKGMEGLQYHLPPNSLTKMRLKVDDIKGIPLFNYNFMFKGHKLKSFSSESELEKRVKQLGDLIEEDLKNINSYIVRWHELHQPNLTDWEGNHIKE